MLFMPLWKFIKNLFTHMKVVSSGMVEETGVPREMNWQTVSYYDLSQEEFCSERHCDFEAMVIGQSVTVAPCEAYNDQGYSGMEWLGLQ